MKISRKIEGCFEGVLRVFQENFKVVSMKFQGCFMKVSRVFLEFCKGVSRKLQLCFEEVSWMLQGCFVIFKDISRVF